MMRDAEYAVVERETEQRSAAGPIRECLHPSLGRSEAMLRLLGRDDTLRRIYVRRRWQGLVSDA
jgi:hypothetical protein